MLKLSRQIYMSALLILVLVAGLAAPTQVAHATDLCVDLDGVTCPYTTIEAAVAAATAGDTINVHAGTYVLGSTLTLDKMNLTLRGEGSPLIQMSGINDGFNITASGVTIDGFKMEKTDKTNQTMIRIAAGSASITNNEIFGHFELGDGEVSRAMVINAGAFTGLNISNNTIHNLRQPAYISGTHTGTIANNYVYRTKGWVVEGGDLTFTDNTWGTGADANAFDIAILNLVGPAYYTDIPAMAAANNGAFIEDQRTSPFTLSIVHVDASVGASGSGTATSPLKTIAEGITRVVTGGTIHVAAGTYAEDLTINKSLDLLGPNAAVNPNTGTRAAEAVLHPATSHPDRDVCTNIAYLSSSDITLKGFTFDGDNPLLTSGFLVNGADVDACEILSGFEGMGHIVVENNILRNASEAGIDFYNSVNPAATAGNYIRYNLIENIGIPTTGFGQGILLYNNFYADVTDNVLDNVRIGIQTGNFYQANPGTTGRISNNEIHTWRLGIFHNLWYSAASEFPVRDNTISVIDRESVARWVGIAWTSFSVPGTMGPNTITATDVSQQTTGYMIWNDYLASGLSVTGGTVTGADYGVWVNNYAGYNTSANNTAITVDNVTISDAALAGIYVQDDALNTKNATVQATIANSPISGSAVGVLIEGPEASATGSCNQIAGNTAGVNNTTSTLLNFEENWWGSVTGPSGAGLGSGDSVSANVDYTPWNVDTTCESSTSNLPPVITEGASVDVTMSEGGTPTSFSLNLNATDPDVADTLTWSISTPAAHGTAAATGTGLSKAIEYTPNTKYKGADSFVVQVSDGTASDTITVNVTVQSDGPDTTGVFRPSNGLLYLKNQNLTGFADVALNYGLPGDYPVVGDWDGNGTVTIGVYRNGYFYLRNQNTVGFAQLVFPFGNPGDQPIAGDWDGDGDDTIGVYRSSTGQFLLRNSNDAGSPEMSFYLGNVGDVGVAGDWNGDGKDTTGVFRPSNGVIFLKNTNETGFANIALNYGLPGDKPVMGDWNDDGIDTIGIYRGNKFYLRNENTNGFANIVFSLGNTGDMPIAGNWNGIP